VLGHGPRTDLKESWVPHKVINPEGIPNYTGQYCVNSGVVVGDTLWMAGQVPLADRATRPLGKTFAEQCEQVFDQLSQVLDTAGFSWDDVVKLNVYLNTPPPHEDVIDIYSEILRRHLKTGTPHEKPSVAQTFMNGCLPYQGTDRQPGDPPNYLEVEGIAIKVPAE
jgi:2-iminobutanoate/2-iminopropanoate deaminase